LNLSNIEYAKPDYLELKKRTHDFYAKRAGILPQKHKTIKVQEKLKDRKEEVQEKSRAKSPSARRSIPIKHIIRRKNSNHRYTSPTFKYSWSRYWYEQYMYGPWNAIMSPSLFFTPQLSKVIEVLDEEIECEVKKIEEFNESRYSICKVIQSKVEETMKVLFSEIRDATTSLYGSMAIGLALPHSDIDIAILNLYKENGLEEMGEYLSRQEYVISCNVISTARVPVIKLVLDPDKFNINAPNKIKVDIIIETPIRTNESLAKNGIKFIEWAKEEMKRLPLLKPITLIFKALLANAQLNVPYYGNFVCTVY
jgi:DNA polymerase sigma